MMKSTSEASLIAEYKRLLGKTIRGNHSIYASEMYHFWKYAQDFDVRRIVESGTYHGSSIARLRMLFPKAELITFEFRKGHFNRIKRVDGVDYRLGELKNHLKLITPHTAVLIDGPKRKNAVRLARQCLNKGALFVGIHDMYDHVGYLGGKVKRLSHSGTPSAEIKKLDCRTKMPQYSKKYYGTVLAVVR